MRHKRGHFIAPHLARVLQMSIPSSPKARIDTTIRPLADLMKKSGYRKFGRNFVKLHETSAAVLGVVSSSFNSGGSAQFGVQTGATPHSVEWVLNHLHIASLHRHDDDELAEDKVILLGEALCEIYRAKLASQFPERPCVVEFYRPEKDGEIYDYQLSFWQAKHDPTVPDKSLERTRGE